MRKNDHAKNAGETAKTDQFRKESMGLQVNAVGSLCSAEAQAAFHACGGRSQ
jgi:hypothetical protein